MAAIYAVGVMTDQQSEDRSRALRIARESLGLPNAKWGGGLYDTPDLDRAAAYLKTAYLALQCEVARRTDKLTDEMQREYKQQRADVAASYSDPSMALCDHGLRPGVCPDC